MSEAPTTLPPEAPDLRELAARAITSEMPSHLALPLIEVMREQMMKCRPGDIHEAQRFLVSCVALGGFLATEGEATNEAADFLMQGVGLTLVTLGMTGIVIPTTLIDRFGDGAYEASMAPVENGTLFRVWPSDQQGSTSEH